MLFELKIKDFILIENETVNFTSGLNIITGETGAGKSMILGALNLVLGGQASKDAVRIGAEKASIKASFYTSDRVNLVLEKYDIPTDVEIVIISREIQAKGKSLTRINGQITPLNILREVTDVLIDIHGQNENQRLFEKMHQLNLLDAYGGKPLISKRVDLADVYSELKEIENEMESLELDERDKFKRVDFLNFQLSEISGASLRVNEDLDLEKEYEYLSNIENLKRQFEKADVWFKNDYDEGILNKLSVISSDFAKLEGFDDKILDFANRAREAYYLLEDLSHDVNIYKENLVFDPERFSQIERRLDTINGLKTKYGQKIEEILSLEREIIDELEKYALIDQRKIDLQEKHNKLLASYRLIAADLTAERLETSKKFERELHIQLSELNMKETRFKVDIEKLDRPSEYGLDLVEFMICTNLGQPFKPLKKTLSGGELSRLMLAIKITLGHVEEIPTLIFDEIDAGISGLTANAVGEKLSRLAKNCQIICITHLPQIAVFSDRHLLIEKSSENSKTVTNIKEILQDDIVVEIGRLVGGIELTRATHEHAKEMIGKAKNAKTL